MCLLLVSLTIYIPYFLSDENRLTYKGDIVINKSPLHIGIHLGLITLLVLASIYQYITDVDIPSIEGYFMAKLLTGAIFSYFSLLSLIVQIKGFKLRWFDSIVFVVAIITSLMFIFGFISSQLFGGVAAAILCWIFLKYIGSVNIL